MLKELITKMFNFYLKPAFNYQATHFHIFKIYQTSLLISA